MQIKKIKCIISHLIFFLKFLTIVRQKNKLIKEYWMKLRITTKIKLTRIKLQHWQNKILQKFNMILNK